METVINFMSPSYDVINVDISLNACFYEDMLWTWHVNPVSHFIWILNSLVNLQKSNASFENGSSLCLGKSTKYMDWSFWCFNQLFWTNSMILPCQRSWCFLTVCFSVLYLNHLSICLLQNKLLVFPYTQVSV